MIDDFNRQIGENLQQRIFQAIAVGFVEFDRDFTRLTLMDGLDVPDIGIRTHKRLHHHLKRQIPERLGMLAVFLIQFGEQRFHGWHIISGNAVVGEFGVIGMLCIITALSGGLHRVKFLTHAVIVGLRLFIVNEDAVLLVSILVQVTAFTDGNRIITTIEFFVNRISGSCGGFASNMGNYFDYWYRCSIRYWVYFFTT